MDGARERLSEQQFNRLVDYIAKTSCHLAPSCSSMQTSCSVVAVEPPPATVRTYHYLADPHFAQVFISKFTMVKNKALRKGFPWVPQGGGVGFFAEQQSSNTQHGQKAKHVCSNRHTNFVNLHLTFSPNKKDTPPSGGKNSKWERNKWSKNPIYVVFLT